jgi:hypothetical protein
VAGYGLLDTDVPDSAEQMIRWIASALYEMREPYAVKSIGQLPISVESLLSCFVVAAV